MFCWDQLDQDEVQYDEVDLTNGVGCCILSKFDYCVKSRIQDLCSKAAVNVTMTSIEMLSLSTSTDCKIPPGGSLPKFPSVECDNIMLPGSRFEGLLGLVISVSLFSLVVGVFVWIILCLAKRSMARSNSYQALWLSPLPSPSLLPFQDNFEDEEDALQGMCVDGKDIIVDDFDNEGQFNGNRTVDEEIIVDLGDDEELLIHGHHKFPPTPSPSSSKSWQLLLFNHYILNYLSFVCPILFLIDHQFLLFITGIACWPNPSSSGN